MVLGNKGNMIYTLTLNTSLDYVVHVDELRVGEIHKTENYSIFPGGKGINVSQVLYELGLDNTALGFVAGHTGTCLEAIMADKHIKTNFVHLSCGITRINMKVRSTDTDGDTKETDFNGIGPIVSDEELNRLKSILKSVSAEDTVIVSGSVPPSISISEYSELIGIICENKATLIVDAISEYLKEALTYHPFLIKPNKQELLDLFDEADRGEEMPVLMRRLQDMGARNVLVSLGGDGAVLLTEMGEVIRMEAPKGNVINTVGAGDSMVAGFVAGFRENGDYREAVKMGICAGSATAFAEGLATGNATRLLAERF